MKTLYLDCFAGASGNIIPGTLIALEIDENELIEQLQILNVADLKSEGITGKLINCFSNFGRMFLFVKYFLFLLVGENVKSRINHSKTFRHI